VPAGLQKLQLTKITAKHKIKINFLLTIRISLCFGDLESERKICANKNLQNYDDVSGALANFGKVITVMPRLTSGLVNEFFG